MELKDEALPGLILIDDGLVSGILYYTYNTA